MKNNNLKDILIMGECNSSTNIDTYSKSEIDKMFDEVIVGDMNVDLSDYYTKAEINEMIESDDDNVIDGGTY